MSQATESDRDLFRHWRQAGLRHAKVSADALKRFVAYGWLQSNQGVLSGMRSLSWIVTPAGQEVVDEQP